MSWRRAPAWLSLVALLSACGPMYHTTYDYTSPRSRIGRLCTAQCDTTHQQCRGTADSSAQTQYSQCEIQAKQDYQQCLNTANDPKQRNVCILDQCNSRADYRQCDADYRSCYSGCGGNVSPQKQCVFDCPKADSAGDR